MKNLKEIWKIMNNPVKKNDLNKYLEMKKIFEKSVVAKEDLKINSIIKKKDLAFKKPGTGIRALYYKSVIGKKLKRNIKKDAIFKNLDFYEN